MFVSDADAEVEGAPGSPLDVRCLDANKDYIIVTWKQPAVDGGNSILGYFVDRSVSQAKTLKVVGVWWHKFRRWTCFFLTFADARLEPTAGFSAMTPQWSLPDFPLRAWWRVAPTSSAFVLSTTAAWANHPECLSQWLPWIRLIVHEWKVLSGLLRRKETFFPSLSFKALKLISRQFRRTFLWLSFQDLCYGNFEKVVLTV